MARVIKDKKGLVAIIEKGLVAVVEKEAAPVDWSAFDWQFWSAFDWQFGSVFDWWFWSIFDWKWGEVIKGLLTEIAGLKAENSSLRMVEFVAKQVITDLLSQCPTCGERMMALDWNRDVCILTCHNLGCNKFHVPLKHLRKENLKVLGLESLMGKTVV